MNAHLLYRDLDFDGELAETPRYADLAQDLELATLVEAMSDGDGYLGAVARRAFARPTPELDAIRYRQDALRDSISMEGVVRELYRITVDTIEEERKDYLGVLSRYPGAILRHAKSMLALFVHALGDLRQIADQRADGFESEAFRELFSMLRREFDDDYLRAIRDHLNQLAFRHGVLISAGLGEGNRARDYVLRKPRQVDETWLQRLFGPKPAAYTFRIPDRDDSGARAIAEIQDRGIDIAANAAAQAADHIAGFFKMLRSELAFYIGSLNLRRRLCDLGCPTCFPVPVAPSSRERSATELYDPALALRSGSAVVTNDLNADGKTLVMITGANQGGKSTFLRAIGTAQLMMQCGMFVAASSYRATAHERIFTHYRREEDASMTSGKFDEELARMRAISDELRPNSLVLFSESFSSTNEREGADVACEIVNSLLDAGVQVAFVTHQYELARRFLEGAQRTALFLRAERLADSKRTYKLLEAEPLETSYGKDLFDEVFTLDDSRRY